MLSGGALVLTGAPGAGKTSVLEALSGLLEAAGVAHGALESEQLAWGAPWLADDAVFAQLAAVYALQRAAGRRLFLVSATTETAAELEGVVRAVGAEPSLVVCLDVAPATASARVAAREPDWWSGKAALVAHAAELALTIPRLAGVDAVISTEDRDARDVAGEILRRMRDEPAGAVDPRRPR
jgi:thymidylate kinase